MKESATFLDALGFQGMTDQVAIVTKAKENVIFAMAQESDDVRAMLSIRKHELIQKCSFNGQACDIEK
uniref:Uncharacterized protein n=1 Tax=Plectus sambesii TaxID=2011161 RepID=A0A914XFH9_9BILA